MQSPSPSAPMLPPPRQPSPLSFSYTSDGQSIESSASSIMPSINGVQGEAPTAPEAGPSRIAFPSTSVPLKDHVPYTQSSTSTGYVPILPVPDSILYRSTVNHLETSSHHLKKLSKSLLSHSAIFTQALEAVQKAEDDFLIALGEIAKYLGNEYSELDNGLWGGSEEGIRKIRGQDWQSRKEEVNGMVDQGVMAIKNDLKRRGLAGHGAQTKFDRTSKQYYDQTSTYLSEPQSPTASNHIHSQSMSVTSSSSTSQAHPPSSHSTAVEAEQAARTASFDLARYSHHSTLLYLTPPSSITCLDLLVNLYSYTGGLLNEGGVNDPLITPTINQEVSTLIPTTPKVRSVSLSLRSQTLKESISSSLSQLADIRIDLLDSWNKRNYQTTRLEEEVYRLQGIAEGMAGPSNPSSRRNHHHHDQTNPGMNTTPISSNGVEYKKGAGGRMHKMKHSMGGKLRDLLGSSTSQRDLSTLSSPPNGSIALPSPSTTPGYKYGQLSSRASFDVSALPSSSSNQIRTMRPVNEDMDESDTSSAKATIRDKYMVDPNLFPLPFIPQDTLMQPETTAQLLRRVSASTGMLGRVSQSDATRASFQVENDSKLGLRGLQKLQIEDDRDDIGRKKEGVLWGNGMWEEVGRSGRTKWERYWVVLDRSSIYEYRDSDFEKPETPHAVIDLKFASVREGRGIERRFVFEIVTPTRGRRLYQATSEAEMKQWIYAICNAIESVIQGISSVRTFDTSKLRTISGAYDDHALPVRARLGFPVPGIPARSPNLSSSQSTNFTGISGIPGSPAGRPMLPRSPSARRSMPPLAFGNSSTSIKSGAGSVDDVPGEGKRKRQTSFKKVLKQGTDIKDKWNNAIGRDSNKNNVNNENPRSSTYLSTPDEHSVDNGRSTPSQKYQIEIDDTDHENVDTSFGSWLEIDNNDSTRTVNSDDIEKRVLEMAGLGLGGVPSIRAINPQDSDGRRIKSEIHPKDPSGLGGKIGEEMSRSKSANVPPTSINPGEIVEENMGRKNEKLDMATLRKIADLPENNHCADCGKSTKSSRWASISLRGIPMVIFICIRCCGIHRSFGTHISKPRSVDLDIWSEESISAAKEWGNVKANRIWENRLQDGQKPTRDEDVAEYLKRKYVLGDYLSDDMRARLGLQPREGVQVGLAISSH